MILLLPEVKQLIDKEKLTRAFSAISFQAQEDADLVQELAQLRFWNYPDLIGCTDDSLPVTVIRKLPEAKVDKPELYTKQGYALVIGEEEVFVYYAQRAGLVNALTSLKQLLKPAANGYCLPQCEIVDYPSLEVRAIAQTFSWYAGYGRFGFDSQLWGYDE